MELNEHQFKIDLGRVANETHDYMESVKHDRQVPNVTPGVHHAEPGYYSQPKSSVRQLALPGMEMSVQDHLDALGKATGTVAKIDSGKISHRLMLMEPYTETTSSGYSYETASERSHMSYDNKRGARKHTDSGEAFEPQYHPGEIRMIKSGKPGDASAMLSAAESLAQEHGMAYPKHSHDRTGPGVAWSQKMMKRRGDKVF